jgi:hypothetical protein
VLRAALAAGDTRELIVIIAGVPRKRPSCVSTDYYDLAPTPPVLSESRVREGPLRDQEFWAVATARRKPCRSATR